MFQLQHVATVPTLPYFDKYKCERMLQNHVRSVKNLKPGTFCTHLNGNFKHFHGNDYENTWIFICEANGKPSKPHVKHVIFNIKATCAKPTWN